MKKLSVLLLLFTLLANGPLRAEAPRFSLLTCSPGDEAYSLFGHTALRYCDEERGLDKVYNYGYFDFSSPNFAWRFILGQTDYIVAAVPYRHFIVEYVQRGSSVVEQVLNLDNEQINRLYRLLEENCLVRNRQYRYNYFYANCTTKARDKVVEALGDGCNVVYGAQSIPETTMREALASFTAVHPWYSFGIDLLMGSDVDKEASRADLQFAPINLMKDFADASVVDASGNTVPLVKATNQLAPENKPLQPRSNFTPFNAALLLLLFTFVVMLCELRSKKTYWGFDLLLMTVQGLGGVLLLFMGLCSEHPAVDANFAMLLINPIALLLMPVALYRIIKHRSPVVMWVQVVFVTLFFLSGIVGLQYYPVPLYFCAVALLVRSLFHIYKENICELDIV